MLSISHAVTGAFIATKVSNPYLAIPLILLAHYLEDAVPHWDAGTGLTKGVKSPSAAFAHELIDLALAGALVLLFYHAQYPLVPILAGASDRNLAPYWGALLALLPDFLEAPRNFFKYEPRWLAPLNRFHHSFHHSIPHVAAGLAPQIILLVLLWIYR